MFDRLIAMFDVKSSYFRAFLTFAIVISWADLSVQQQPNFVEQPQNATVREGDSAILQCVLDTNVRDCAWQRDNTNFAMGGRYNYAPGTNDGRDTRNCSIQITQFNKAFDGVAWQCVILGSSDSKTMTSSAAYLIPLVQPSDPTIQLNRIAVSQLSYPLRGANMLICVSRRGNPATELSWELDGQPMKGLYSVQAILSSEMQQHQQGRVDNPLYDAVLEYDLVNEGAKLDRVKQLKCIARHPSYRSPVSAIAIVTRDYPTKRVEAYVEGSNDSTLEVESDRRITLSCIADGRPTPTYEWQYRVDSTVEWEAYESGQNVSVIGLGGQFRCLASNRLNTLAQPPSAQEIVLKVKTAVETSNFGIVVGIIIAVVAAIVILLLIIVFLYRRKSWIFAPKPIDSAVDKDAEAANGGDTEKPDEKTALSQESQYENVGVNGKDEEMNGKKPGDSPIKNDQNANKQPSEVVYAQLDLVNTAPKTAKTQPEYEKTEYAEIRFNNKENKV